MTSTKTELLSKELRALINRDDTAKFSIVLTGILILSGLAYLSLAAYWPKFSRAEVFFAECVREMLATNNLVTPLYHGTPFFDKPILSYWFIAISYNFFGVSHLSSRIPSILAALGTLSLTAFGARYFFGNKAGTLAAAVLASSFMFMSFASLCMSDMALVFFDTGSLTFFYAALASNKYRRICFWLTALSMGLAFLTKGPVGIVLPALFFSCFLTITKQWSSIKIHSHVIPALIITALAASPWFLAAYRENGAGALSYFFIRENFERFAGSTYDTHRPLWFMLVSLFSGLLPWSIFLPFAFKNSWKLWQTHCHSSAADKHLYLWLWVILVTTFFSFSRGKIDYYVLPVYPAACILIGSYLSNAFEEKSVRILSGLAGIIFLAGGVASLAAFSQAIPNILNWIWTPLALFSGGLLICLLLKQGELRKAYKCIFVSICLTAMAFSMQIYPWISSQQAVLAYMPILKAAPQETRIGVHTSLQSWIDEITYQTGKEPFNIKNPAMATQFLKSKAKVLLLIPQKEFQEIPNTAHILKSHPFIKQSLTPGYFLSHSHKLADDSPLLLVSN